ncbi:MAG TPA: amino acid adenylation domain-containing protein [Pyrinomonadaceae bacterium]|nr:amino acid adenylation domain-containing protein [Pyrinomonadaceae bacterium]
MQQQTTTRGFRLSPQQKRLWSLQQHTVGLSDRAQCTVLIEGHLDTALLRTALQKVVERHEVLSTTFPRPQGMNAPLQVIAEGRAIWDEYDLSGVERAQQEAEIGLLFDANDSASAGLAGELPLRLALIKLAPEKHVLLISLPALSADNVSLNNLVREVGNSYAARADEYESVQYVVVSEWLNDLLESGDATEGVKFWRGQDYAALVSLHLPFEREADASAQSDIRSFRLTIGPEFVSALEELAQKHDSSLQTLLLACWKILLHRWTGQPDTIVGTVFDGRTDEELEGALGLFARQLPIRSHIDQSSLLGEILRGLEEAKSESFEWQECFVWEKAIGDLSNASGGQFFPYCFEFMPAPAPVVADGVTFSLYERRAVVDRFHLKLDCELRDGSLVLTHRYEGALYDADAVERLAYQYEALLASVLATPETPVGELKMLGDKERELLIHTLNDTAADFPQEKLLHRLFEEQAARTPELVALEWDGGKSTYEELDRGTNQLARRLRLAGVGPEVAVGVLLERSPEMVMALLGVLKAGGFYVPLNPSLPRERLLMMLEDAQVKILLTVEPLVHVVTGIEVKTICLDSECGEVAEADVMDHVATPDNLAYVIHTSGSTGRPKGVMIPHGAICNRLLWMQSAYPLGVDDSVLQKTVFNFDASVWELFVPLMTGAKIVLARPDGHQDAAYMAEEITRRGVTTLQLVPSMLRVMLDEPGFSQCRTLKRVFCGGEALPLDLQERFYATLDADLHNLYGPTEVSIDASSWDCERGSDYGTTHGNVPIGRPLANVQIYLLDGRLQPVPYGATGEVYVGGRGLGRGYLGRPDLTAEKFVPDPFGGKPGARLYKTGDLGRLLPQGAIEFLGRIDHQIKLRGFRIELGEIEAALRQHPEVREALALIREDGGNQQLVAYVLPAAQPSSAAHALSSQELRQFLQEKLPDYMIPSAFVLLDELPLTPSGKVDRNALPAPGRDQHEADGDMPRTPLEELVAGVWARVLGLDHVGVNKNFFDLGGHSLLATQVVTRLREAANADLPLRSIFEAPTVAGMAKNLEAVLAPGGGVVMPPIEPVRRDQQLPLSYAQQRVWFMDQLEADNFFFNVPAAFRLVGKLKPELLERTLNEVVRRHESLRTTFAEAGGELAQRIAPSLRIELPIQDLSELPEAERDTRVRQLADEEARRPFNLAHGPLLRAKLLRLGDEEHVALVTMHHIVSDGWSMGVLVREVSALYEAFASGLPSPLPELPIQYVDYAAWQRRWMQGELLEEQLSYWKSHLAGRPETLQLPTDRPRPPVQTYSGASQSLALPPSLAESLNNLCRQENATLFMLLLATFNVLLHRYTGQTDVVVGTDVANRNRVEIENLVGFFVNQLVIRTDLSGDPAFRALLARVRAAALGAYAHQDIPFEKLVEELRPERDVSRTPLFQVKLVLQNAPFKSLELPGLTLSPIEFDGGKANLDLTLFLNESERGLVGQMEYNTDLFDPQTITRMLSDFELLLARIVAAPEAQLSDLVGALAAAERERAEAERKRVAEESFKKFKGFKPKAVSVPREELVTTGSITNGASLPLVLRPNAENLDLAVWAERNRDMLQGQLVRHGAILFRDFKLDPARDFGRLAHAVCSDLFHENGEHPRRALGDGVYTPVFYPPEQLLLWHNENSFNHRWPARIWFGCVQPATRGGETPLADSRKVYALIDKDIRRLFSERGVMYVRNYGEGLGLDWQTVFQTDDRREVERRCREARMEIEWKQGGRARTRCVRPASVRHPQTGELSWFNQAQHWHVSCLDPETRAGIQAVFSEEDYPRHCYFGDGTPIDDSVMAEVLEAYRQTEVVFAWQEGDILMVDNVLTAHARRPFEGSRELLVAMGDMRSFDEVEAA